MTVRAITPRLLAISGHLQFQHAASCAGDCCNHDAANDLLTTGEDIYDPEWPDKPLRLGRRTQRPPEVRIPLRNRAGEIVTFAIVSPEDNHLADFRWCLMPPNGRNPNGYVRRKVRQDGKRVNVYLHRAVLGLSPGDGMDGDHINGDRLDNRRENLRATTRRQNGQNVPSQAGTSRHRGVSLRPNGTWKAQVMVDGRTRHVGIYATEDEAASAAANFRAAVFTHTNEARSTRFVPGELRTASIAESQPRVHASSPRKTGRDGRGSAPTLPTSVDAALPRVGEPSEQPGSRPDGSDTPPTDDRCAETPVVPAGNFLPGPSGRSDRA